MTLTLICRFQRRIGFECLRYYTTGGEPAENVAEPAHRKCDAISMTRRQEDIAANGPSLPVDLNDPMKEATTILPPPPATAEEDKIGNIAMELGETREDTSKKGRGRGGRAEWTCSPTFERDQGGTPRARDSDPEMVDDMKPPPWEPPNEEDELDTDLYTDLQVPDGFSDDDYWSP